MENFVIKNPTVLHFGKNVINNLPKIAKHYGNKAFLISGKGSIFKNGVYDNIIEQLGLAGVKFVEYRGIKPNPVSDDVDRAAEVGRVANVDFIIAAGGGSVIDSAKMISIAMPVNHSVWDFYEKNIKPVKALPLITVLTVAATGTEMNCFAVLQNNRTMQKEGFSHSLLYPKHSFADPCYTFSVSKTQTAYGIVDIIAHCLENYFGNGHSPISDKIAIATIQEVIDCACNLLNNLNDYDLRARIMYASTVALNGWNSYGKSGADWGAHSIGHVLSLLYDIPHGASLSIVYPAWLKHHQKNAKDKILKLGAKIFGVNSTIKTVECFENFFKSLNCPVSLKDALIPFEKYDEILNTMLKIKVSGSAYALSHIDIKNIFSLMSR